MGLEAKVRSADYPGLLETILIEVIMSCFFTVIPGTSIMIHYKNTAHSALIDKPGSACFQHGFDR